MAAERHVMAPTETPAREQRYPEVVECTWRGHGKCVVFACRYSLLQERPHIASWDSEDFGELVDALPSTCSLDLAELGGMRLEEVAMVMGVPRPRVEQLEISAMRKLAMSRELRKIRWDGR
jgi:DNA-directed RNA polymerase specialized sigma24 family protein